MGRINTGGAKKRTGDNIALASSVSGTTLKLSPPKGYYDGVSGTVNITDADFVASKILLGTNLFGVNGTYEFIPIMAAGSTKAYLKSDLLTTNSSAFVKIREVKAHASGVVNLGAVISIELNTVSAEFRKNGVLIGTTKTYTGDGSYTPTAIFENNVTIAPNDLLQLWVKTGNSTYPARYSEFAVTVSQASLNFLFEPLV